MDEKFHRDTRRVLALAEQEARRLQHSQVDPIHIMLGLVESLTLDALFQKLAVDGRRVRLDIEEQVQAGSTEVTGQKLPRSAETQTVLDEAILASGMAGYLPYLVEPAHLLLGLLREGKSPAAKALTHMGFTESRVRLALTPWGELIQPWHVERHYLPALLDLDNAVSRMERLIWEREYPNQHDTHRTREVIHSPTYNDPLAEWRNRILPVRNHLAALCGIKERAVHDVSADALGYTVVDGEVHVPSLPVILKLDPRPLRLL